MTTPTRPNFRDLHPLAKSTVLLVLMVMFVLAGVLLAGLLIAFGVLVHGAAVAWS